MTRKCGCRHNTGCCGARRAAARCHRPDGIRRKTLRHQGAGECPKDPDPTGLVNNDYYFKCGPSKLGNIKNRIGEALTSRYGVAAITEDNPDYILAVTLTKDMVDKGTASSGVLDFLVPDAVVMSTSFTFQLAATYQLAGP